jgi:DNA-directed RNA polymerase sigma subunit (sigma70/sigma32)
MVLSKILSKGKMRLAKGLPVEIEQLDLALDVPTSRFERVAGQLAVQMRRHQTDVNVAGYRDRRAIAPKPKDARAPVDVRGGGFYQVELRQLPPMDRAEEFRMARRYDFLKLRVRRELERFGMSAKAAGELAGKPRSAVQQALPPAAQRDGYLARCLLQLEELRNLYVEGALYIVMGTVARYRGLGVDTPDLIQEGNASLFQAIEGFDWRREVRFRTYAQ